MRRILTLIPAVAIATALFAQAPASKATSKAPATASKATAPAVAKAAPVTPRKAGEFVINMIDGSQKLLSSYRGKLVVMAFMYTTCEHCQHTAGILSKVQTEYADKGVQVLGVTIDQGAKQGIPAFLRVTGANFPVGYSTAEQAMKFLHGPAEGWYVPMIAFVDQTGTVRSQYIVTDPGDPASKWLDEQDFNYQTRDRGNFRKEIDKFLKTAAPAKQAPKP